MTVSSIGRTNGALLFDAVSALPGLLPAGEKRPDGARVSSLPQNEAFPPC